MLCFYLGESVDLSEGEREVLARIVSSMLKNAGGDAGRLMFDAYYRICAETVPETRSLMLDFLEKVRISYVSSEREKTNLSTKEDAIEGGPM